MTIRINAPAATFMLLILFPAMSSARSNTVDTGLSISYDYDDRKYDTITGLDGVQIQNNNDNEYRDIVISPLIHFISRSQKDQFEIRISPSLKYDLNDSDTDWDTNLLLGADRSINKNWRIIGSNTLIRSDSNETSSLDSDTQTTQLASPELSGNFGRTQYWRNDLSLDSEHRYGQESIMNFGFDYVLLRNDESDFRSYDDYDRYAGSITNSHRFNQNWSLITDLSVVRGDFETTGPTALLTEEDAISDDLMEYHILETVENRITRQTTLAASYNYIGTRYDESLQYDGDIHQLQLTWAHIFSSQTTVTLGAGPSYQKTEDSSSNTGGNGIAEIEYQNQRSTVTFGVEKRYSVDNFSGAGQRGFVDYWDTSLRLDHQLSANLSLNGQARYRYEDREDPSALLAEADNVNITDEYNTKRLITGLGISYNFSRYYTASIDYTYTNQDSDRIGDNYDDNRVLVTLAWEQNWLRW